MLVNLYNLPNEYSFINEQGIKIMRVLPPDIYLVTEFIKENFSLAWASEVSVSLYKSNPTCFIALKDQEIIGFACYDASAKGFFGPIGVAEKYRSYGVGKALLMKTLIAMREDGYVYAIIGSASGAKAFYEKTCKAIEIPNSDLSVYERMICNN